MKLEDKMKMYVTVRSVNCHSCGNPWYFDKKEEGLECTTCHKTFRNYVAEKEKKNGPLDPSR